MKLLSICIPTYNRKDCLIQCLESIVNKQDLSEIEIVISDNASSDGTNEIMKEYLIKYPNIIYFRNDENIGFDKNVLKVISLASGKYCLFIGDDDAFFDQSLTNTIDILKTWRAEYYITNNWWYDISLKYPVTLEPSLSITTNQYYQTLKDFIFFLQPDKIRTVWFFWGMSGQIFLKERWDAFTDKERFIWTQTIHLFMLLSIMKENTFWLIALPTIKTRADNIRWDTFDMNNAFRREELTRKTFCFIADIYKIPYSNIALHIIFLKNYLKNLSIIYVKKYILKDQKTILKIKKYLAKVSSYH